MLLGQAAIETAPLADWPLLSVTVKVSVVAELEQISDRLGLWVEAEGVKVLLAPDQP
jgi:hypothetical protein